MRVKIKISLAIIVILGGLFLVSTSLFAHPGNTDSSGCHTCRTNCPSWGLSYGEYHCHRSKGIPQPEYPITCKYGIGCEPVPEYQLPDYYPSYNYPTVPDCPIFSTYDSLSGSCKCNYGYIVSGSSCVNGNTYCHGKYGYNSSYSSLSKTCECDYGYVFNTYNQCVSRDDYCEDLYGYNTEYSYLGDNCKCKSGYIFNSSMTQCIDGDSYCWSNYGYNSDYNSLSKTCECDYGYEFRNNKCIEQEDEEEEDFYIYKPISPFTFNKTPKSESDTTSTLKPQTSSNDTPEAENKIISESREEVKCDPGYTLSFNKKSCVKVPENAHAVDSSTDLWLCNDGYKEINNTCVLVENQEEALEQGEKQEVQEQPREKKKVLKFLANALTTVGDLFKNFFKLLIKR